MQSTVVDRLASLVAARAAPAAAAWFAAQLHVARTQPAGARQGFFFAFSAAGRRLGPAPVVLSEGEAGDEALLVQGRGLDEVGRIALLLAELSAEGAAGEALVNELFYRGELREKQAVLRALPLLPAEARSLEVALEACRSSVQDIFEAIACENPYPADRFDDAAFNQLVLKALFIAVPVARIAGLGRRATPELLRMADAYGSERRATGRSVPDDIELIRALVAQGQGSHS